MVQINDNYYVDRNGNVYSNFHGKFRKLKPYTTRARGRGCVDMYGKPYQVHRLIAQAFVDNPLNKSIVHHIDGNEHNNKADNLMWCTIKEHQKLHKKELSTRKNISPTNCKLTYEQANEIRELYKNTKITHREIAKMYNVSKTTIGDLLRNKYYCIKKCND